MIDNTCATCAKPFVSDGCGTGYGQDKDGAKHCYACCADRDRVEMISDGRATLYLTAKGITNWPGSLVFPTFPHIAKSRNNFGAERRDAWFVGPDSYVWHAVSIGDMDLARCKRTRERWVKVGESYRAVRERKVA